MKPVEALNWDGERIMMTDYVATALEAAGWIERVQPGGFFNVVVGYHDRLYPVIARTRAVRAARDNENHKHNGR